jgi:hypothetical protein
MVARWFNITILPLLALRRFSSVCRFDYHGPLFFAASCPDKNRPPRTLAIFLIMRFSTSLDVFGIGNLHRNRRRVS